MSANKLYVYDMMPYGLSQQDMRYDYPGPVIWRRLLDWLGRRLVHWGYWCMTHARTTGFWTTVSTTTGTGTLVGGTTLGDVTIGGKAGG